MIDEHLDSTTGKFHGKSEHGDIHEALEQAIYSAKRELRSDRVQWTLLNITGYYGGFIDAKNLDVYIGATVPLEEKAKRRNPTPESPTDEIQIPTFLSGTVTKVGEASYCFDDATHLLQTILGVARLYSGNNEVLAVLDKASDTHVHVAIAGYPVYGPICNHINVYYAGFIEELFQRLDLVT